MMAAFFFFAHLSLGAFGPYLSSRSLAEVINREYQPGDAIVINGEYEGGASINFYTRKMVYISERPLGESGIRVLLRRCATNLSR